MCIALLNLHNINFAYSVAIFVFYANYIYFGTVCIVLTSLRDLKEKGRIFFNYFFHETAGSSLSIRV